MIRVFWLVITLVLILSIFFEALAEDYYDDGRPEDAFATTTSTASPTSTETPEPTASPTPSGDFEGGGLGEPSPVDVGGECSSPTPCATASTDSSSASSSLSYSIYPVPIPCIPPCMGSYDVIKKSETCRFPGGLCKVVEWEDGKWQNIETKDYYCANEGTKCSSSGRTCQTEKGKRTCHCIFGGVTYNGWTDGTYKNGCVCKY